MARIAVYAVFCVSIVIAAGILGAKLAGAHHTGVECGPGGRTVCLPSMHLSRFTEELRTTVGYSYCLNSRANGFPGFSAQVDNVTARQADALGIVAVRVAGTYETPTEAKAVGCDLLHSMPNVHACTGCAAWILYLNWPILIEYKWQVGYSDWETTISHELDHAHGLHEHYDDISFTSYRQGNGVWAHGFEPGTDPGTPSDTPTVMDVGTGIKFLTLYDTRYICELNDRDGLLFTGCGLEVETAAPANLEQDVCRDGRAIAEFRWEPATRADGGPPDVAWLDLSITPEGFRKGTWCAGKDYGCKGSDHQQYTKRGDEHDKRGSGAVAHVHIKASVKGQANGPRHQTRHHPAQVEA